MIENGKLFCNTCRRQIRLDVARPARVLVELVKRTGGTGGASDRHYCENCSVLVRRLPQRPLQPPLPAITSPLPTVGLSR